ncbi:MAG: ABC transporter ATP-binding protein [Parachlamydiaceae bacterium]|nr:ABC transporter ATP-binding protein [Parachlamydiaceae bacterium]
MIKHHPLQNTSSLALEVHQLSVNYDKIPVLWDITLEIEPGKIVGIVGPNGAGKSTFIKTALGLLQPISGKIEFFGQPLKNVRRRIAYVPQRETVDWDFPITVRDLVLMGRYGTLGVFQWPRQSDYTAVEHCLGIVGMSGYASRQISQLSGGQQQRVFIARALVQEADVYFMDEPFAGIDMATETVIMNILRQLKEKGKTVFVVHHDLNTVENYFDWLIMLNMRLIACGPVTEVFNPDTLNATFGKSYALFDAALKLSQHKTKGMPE